MTSQGGVFLHESWEGLGSIEYVTSKALDGLFVLVADEKKRIRENPQARITELLQKVFGTLQKGCLSEVK